MRVPGSRKRQATVAFVGAVLVLALGAGIRACDHPAPIYYWKTVDQYTLVVGVDTGPWSWTRVTGVEETSTSVTVWVSSFEFPLPGTDVRHPVELTVKLRDPLGGRIEIAGSGGVAHAGSSAGLHGPKTGQAEWRARVCPTGCTSW